MAKVKKLFTRFDPEQQLQLGTGLAGKRKRILRRSFDLKQTALEARPSGQLFDLEFLRSGGRIPAPWLLFRLMNQLGLIDSVIVQMSIYKKYNSEPLGAV